MVFREQTYRVLIVSAGPRFNDTLTQMLPGTDFHPVTILGNVAAARRELVSRSYDFVIINAPLPDDLGVRFAIDACGKTGTVVLLMVKAELYEEIEAKVSPQGVFLLQKPTSSLLLQQSIKWMMTARERMRRSEAQTTSIEEKMEEIRLVNRAKWLLIDKRKMTEADAHRYIEREAMNRCIPRREVAAQIISEYA